VDRTDLTAAGIVHDVALEVLEDDPYPTYAWMRRHRPVAFVPETGRVWITTWDLCDEAGRNDKVFGPTSEVFHAVYGNPNVMSLSGPEHLAHRAALNACFRPRAVNGYREHILRATAVRYIDAIRDQGQADANSEILERISMRAIGDVMGFTDVHDDILIRWFRGFAAYLVDFGRSSEVAEHGRAIKAELAADLRTRLDSLAAHPDGSTVSHLLHDGMPDGTTRGIDEIIGDIGVMIVGGFQEPAHGAANSLHGLFTRPEQAARLRADPSAWSAAAVEEGLRWLAPFGMTEKLTTADVPWAASCFPSGPRSPWSSAQLTAMRRGTPTRTSLTWTARGRAMLPSATGCISASGTSSPASWNRSCWRRCSPGCRTCDPIRIRKLPCTAGRYGPPSGYRSSGTLNRTRLNPTWCR
jgi:aromatic O-demethylase, cytochrome P450 subunit